MASAQFALTFCFFPFHFETSEVCSCRRTPCREQHVSLPRLSKNESLPNCVLVPEWHCTIIPLQHARKQENIKQAPGRCKANFIWIPYNMMVIKCIVLLRFNAHERVFSELTYHIYQ